jgi:carbon monoxide dehydrogenase subunit G
MELTGEQLVRAPRIKVWEALNDPTILSRCIPGCEEVSKKSESETYARVMIKVGPVRARFAGNMVMHDMKPPAECTLSFEGAGGAAGFAKGRSVVKLLEDGEATRIVYTVEAAIGGKLGQIGGRLIDSSAKKMADEFFAAFDAALAGPAQPDASADLPNAPVPTEPSTRATAAIAKSEPGHMHVGSVGFRAELYRAFWFSLGVAFTLLVTRWLP